jgi:hypothetical protein
MRLFEAIVDSNHRAIADGAKGWFSAAKKCILAKS